MNANTSATDNKVNTTRRPLWRRILKVTSWVVMAIVLYAVGLFAATLGILRPERLTPLLQTVANNTMRADVTIGYAELSARGSFPYMGVELRDLTVVSRDIKNMDAGEREMLPEWADTLLTVKRFEGSVKLTDLISGGITVDSVIIERPQANIVIVDDETTNYNVFPESEEEDTTAFNIADLPQITLTRFAMVDPGPIRFYSEGAMATATFSAVSLSGKDKPLYRLDFDGDIDCPAVSEIFNLEDLSFGLNGNIRWDQTHPEIIAVEDFAFKMSLLQGNIDTKVNIGDPGSLDSLRLHIDPLPVGELLAAVPEDMAEYYGLPIGINTNARVRIDAKLLKPYSLGADGDALPTMNIDVNVEDSYLKWQQVDFRHLSTDLTFYLDGNNLNASVLNIRQLNIAGPATDLRLTGKVTEMFGDPLFDGTVNGVSHLGALPPQLTRLLGGASISGDLTANARIKGRPSMLSPSGFQQLLVKGDIGLRNFRWESDTVNSIYVDRALFRFGTQETFRHENVQASGLLTAHLTIDSVNVTMPEGRMYLTDLDMGVGTRNSHRHHCDHDIQPMGGAIQFTRFDMLSVADSSRVKLRDVKGYAIVRTYEGDEHRPQFVFDLNMRRMSAGDRSTRAVLREAQAHFEALLRPETQRTRSIRLIGDSLHRANPKLDRDSIYALATAEYRRRRGRPARTDSVKSESEEVETIDWGMTTAMRRFLRSWDLSGTITGKRASMYTPYFPLRNRLRNIDIAFTNDSIDVRSMRYIVGSSDFNITGKVTNIRKALTSRRKTQPLQLQLDVSGDSIDINQLAEAVFAGAAYSSAAAAGNTISLGDSDNEIDLECAMNQQVTATTDSVGPVLVPTNVDANIRINSKNVRYGDLMLHDLHGHAMLYNGALNLHELNATSDVGSINLSALYMGRRADELSFGFGMQLEQFNLANFLRLVPAIDSIMPVLRNFSGIIDVDIAATTPISRNMDFVLSGFRAAVKLDGKDLVLIDPDTFKSLSKWLFFKNKKRNMIDSMSIQMMVENSQLQIFPFIFDIDRYRLGVQGYNDFAMNFKYHIAVLKSPIPFKFGINVSGNPDKMKIRLGRARLNQDDALAVNLVDTTRVSLLREISNVFRRGIRDGDRARLRMNSLRDHRPGTLPTDEVLTPEDSAAFIREGLIEAPEPVEAPDADKNKKTKDKKKNKKEKK